MQAPANTSEWLRQHGIRPSVQRIAVMEYLSTHRTHPTADEIYGALAPRIPTLSKTTVYNTLELLVRQGAATQIEVDPHGMRFDGDLRPHGHFFCTECGALHDIFFEPERPEIPMPDATFLAAGHTVRTTQLYYKGICARCRQEERPGDNGTNQ